MGNDNEYRLLQNCWTYIKNTVETGWEERRMSTLQCLFRLSKQIFCRLRLPSLHWEKRGKGFSCFNKFSQTVIEVFVNLHLYKFVCLKNMYFLSIMLSAWNFATLLSIETSVVFRLLKTWQLDWHLEKTLPNNWKHLNWKWYSGWLKIKNIIKILSVASGAVVIIYLFTYTSFNRLLQISSFNGKMNALNEVIQWGFVLYDTFACAATGD